jgi:hypothetical protein
MRRSNRSPCVSMNSTFDRPTLTTADGTSQQSRANAVPEPRRRRRQWSRAGRGEKGVSAMLRDDPQHPSLPRSRRARWIRRFARAHPHNLVRITLKQLGAVFRESRVPLFRHCNGNHDAACFRHSPGTEVASPSHR